MEKYKLSSFSYIILLPLSYPHLISAYFPVADDHDRPWLTRGSIHRAEAEVDSLYLR